MEWYWWLSIFIYSMGISFTAGMTLAEFAFEESLTSAILLILLWPVAVVGGIYFTWLHDYFGIKFKGIKQWLEERKEDKLFYENELDDKFERLGLKFDENGERKT